MRPLIAAEPQNAEHRRFRAELYRLAGELSKARVDYQQVIRVAPESPTGYTGLAEIHAQQCQWEQALVFARQARDRAPGQWMPLYTLGMILDRLGDASEAVQALEQAVSAGVPHSRYRLLTHLWLARNHARLGSIENARQQVRLLHKQARGFKEWQVVLDSEQAAPLRAMLADDVALAGRLIAGRVQDEQSLAELGTIARG